MYRSLASSWCRLVTGRVNGPEYISGKLISWAKQEGIELLYIQPDNPQQNAHIECYNRTVHYDWLSHHLFESIGEVQDFATW